MHSEIRSHIFPIHIAANIRALEEERAIVDEIIAKA